MKTAVDEGVKQLYHYQGANLEYLRDTLVKRRVHFSNPKNFNDPWDCKPYFEPAIDDPESRRKWGARLDGFYKNLSGQLRATLEARWQGKWWDNTELLQRTINELTSSVRHLTTERWRIYCLTPSCRFCTDVGALRGEAHRRLPGAQRDNRAGRARAACPISGQISDSSAG